MQSATIVSLRIRSPLAASSFSVEIAESQIISQISRPRGNLSVGTAGDWCSIRWGSLTISDANVGLLISLRM